MKYLIVYFHTSSMTKFAHIQYLLRRHPVRLRLLHSNRGYPELQERSRLSLQSGAEYLRQKSGFAMPFILEDTEVYIEAYRQQGGISYPGFDVKRWWRVTSFEEIDAKCKKAGTRAASQTSNICLSVPGLAPAFFKGRVAGEISKTLEKIEENPETPWLNGRDFGSIFVPKSARLPFGALPLEESLRFDFRRLAVDKLVARIVEINSLLNLDPNCYRTDENDSSLDQLNLFGIEYDFFSEATEEC